MKLITAFVHHVRTADIVQALADAGFGNITLQEARGALRPITENERDYSAEGGGLVISEARLSLVVEDSQANAVTAIICTEGRVGRGVSGYVYVSPVDQMLLIGSPSPGDTP